ncbi:MAG: NTP/NDP exchange transporter [Oscillospiraceae bacterium]|jgi:AAA family ATP:ADP antiporter|nr:NTP/NDP exchange transporter [Oscillospiraceae bacterium]
MNETQNETIVKPQFSKIQSLLWPVHGYEMKKFFPMSMLMFCILFVYTMVRDLKDVFIQKYAVCGGTELIPVLKLWFVMPAAFLIIMLFTFLVNKFGTKNTFYIMVSIFMAFYIIFLFVLFPNAKSLHLGVEKVRSMQQSAPGLFFYVVPCLTNWSYTLFYIFSEIWGTMAISSLFWQFANQITKKTEVKRFFGLYALIGNIGVFLSGTALNEMSKPSGDEFDRNVKILIGCCIFFCVATMAVYYYMHSAIMTDPRFYDPSEVKAVKKKAKVGMMDGIKFLFTSPYLLLICVLVLAYGVSINFTEVVWKEQMRATLTNANDYSGMMGRLSQFTAVFTIAATLLSTNILRRFSWKISAIITPMVMLILGGLFFALMAYGKMGKTYLFGVSIPILAIWVGLFVDALAKSIKYCLFDSTKSMAYIPLDTDTRVKGQATVEVIGGRAGKAGASTISYILTNIISAGSKISSHLGIIIPMFAITVIGWLMSVVKLSKKYEEKIAEQSK